MSYHDPHITAAAAAKILGVHVNTVRNWAASGKLPVSRVTPSGYRHFDPATVEALAKGMERPPPSYHDLHITTAAIPRTSIFNLPYGLVIHCTRTAGWQLWDMNTWQALKPGDRLPASKGVLLAGEYDSDWLVLDVDGHVIVDSRNDVGEDGGGKIVTVSDNPEGTGKDRIAPESGRSATEGPDRT